ncbi:CotH kinase family protein [Acetobacterium tundrae]|uniref:Spore coat protein CotH n=1 Tax=Acetobacterium tundrae TaxID=132932 RepID=A0ABR6WH68_9FIRM|nr:CotH kinase family protein [Acetobacterium tundrae]MBC3795613.1 spore coat protein CotH [Acetobacterium tundrae]
MANHKNINRICIIISVVTILIAIIYIFFGQALGITAKMADLSYTTKLFDDSTVHTINIEISDSDWNDLQANAADKDYQQCAITIDGETLQNVGIRAKGNSSLSGVTSLDSERYSLKVDFDQYNDGENYHGLDKLNLNNVISDNTYLKDYLTYDMMNYMGIAAPLTSFTRISINGEYFGLYLAVEGVDEAFAARNYGSDSGNIYKPDSMENNDNAAGDMGGVAADMVQMPDAMTQATATTQTADKTQIATLPDMSQMAGVGGMMSKTDVALVYSDDQLSSYENIFNGAVFDVTTADKKTLINSIKQLNEGANLADVVDVDEVLKYFVVHSFVDNFDSYTGSLMHNYYLREVNGQLSIIPWDYNLAFMNFSGGGGGGGQGGNTATTTASTVAEATTLVNYPIDTPVSGTTMADRPLLNELLSNEEYLNLYHQYYNEFITGYFDSGHYTEVIDKAASLISSSVETDPTAFCTYQEYQDGVAVLKEFCALRAESISGQLDGTIPSTTTGQTEQPTTLIDASSIDISAMGTNTVGGGMNMQKTASGDTSATATTAENTKTAETASSKTTGTATNGAGANPPSNGADENPPTNGVGGNPSTNGTGENSAKPDVSTNETAAASTGTTPANETADTGTTDTIGAPNQAPTMNGGGKGLSNANSLTEKISSNLSSIILLGGSLLLLIVGILVTKLFRRR